MAGTMTRLQMANEIMDNMAKGSSLVLQSGTPLLSRCTDFLNRAQYLIARKEDFLQATALATTIAGQLSYSLPSRFRSIFDMRFLDGINTRKLICVLPEEFDKRIPAPDVYTAQRSWFYVPYKNTGTFELFPIPPDAFTLKLRYSYFPAPLASDSQVSDYTDLDDALVAYGTMYGFRWMQELKDAAFWEKTGADVVQAQRELQDENFPDWSPYSQGFSVSGGGYTGEYWNNPFVRSDTLTQWSM